MQAISCTQHNHALNKKLKSKDLNIQHRRDTAVAQTLLQAVEVWESTIADEQRQATITSLVAEKWKEQGGRGITITKLNLYRYLRNRDCSARYTRYALALQPAIVAALPLNIAHQFGWRLDEKTDADLLASAIKETSEAHQARLLGLSEAKRVKETFECLIANAALLPGELAGAVIANLQAVAPQFL